MPLKRLKWLNSQSYRGFAVFRILRNCGKSGILANRGGSLPSASVGVMTSGMMPRLGPSIVRRQGLEEWLGRFSSVPVRFLVAPPGFGKTMALLGYLRHSATNGIYCAIPPGATTEGIWGAIARALEVEAQFGGLDELVRALVAGAPLELALDCEDLPDAGGIEAILALIKDLPEDVALLIACRSRTAFHVGRLVSDGSAVLCDAERLAFDAAGIRQLAETCGVQFTHADVMRMLEATDGWPQIVGGALRKAAEGHDVSIKAQGHEKDTRAGSSFADFAANAKALTGNKD